MELPPGVGFYPNVADQLLPYLKERVLDDVLNRPNSMSNFFPDVNLYQFKPWDIPPYIESSITGNPKQHEWYFFCPRNGPNRKVPEVGFWKMTGKKEDIVSADTGEVMGTKSILVFQPSSSDENGSWVVHEYNLDPSYLGYNINQMPFVACRLKRK